MKNQQILEDMRDLIKAYDQKVTELRNQQLENAIYFSRDIYWKRNTLKRSSDELNGLTFAKTKGRAENLNENKLHSFTKAFCARHLKSNAICTWIPKIACSNLRYSIAVSNGLISGPSDIGWIHANNDSLGASNSELLNADYTFVILRNPFKKLLSYYLDKICNYTINIEYDQSYDFANKLFNSEMNPSFNDFVNTLWERPDLLDQDIHTKKQCDFLIYKAYDDYFSIEAYEETIESIKNKTGLLIHDVRDINTIRTTKGLKESNDFAHTLNANEIRKLIQEGKKPNPLQMYTPEMAKKTAALYLPDILLYSSAVKNAGSELRDWMEKIY